MSDIPLLLTPDELRTLAEEGITAEHSTRIQAKARTALAKHEREEKLAALGLPWAPYPDSCASRNLWKVCVTEPRDDGQCCTLNLVRTLPELQARLVAAAPDMAARWERWLHGETVDIEEIQELLTQAGWLP
jgi:hypothetical protein